MSILRMMRRVSASSRSEGMGIEGEVSMISWTSRALLLRMLGLELKEIYGCQGVGWW
jgi:hypothetical protein